MEIKARGFTFDVFEGGPSDGDPVLLLHGLPPPTSSGGPDTSNVNVLFITG